VKITIVAFNCGPGKKFTNGPGMSLFNFIKSVSGHIKIDLFTSLPFDHDIGNVKSFRIDNRAALTRSISTSSCVHHWSGIDHRFILAGSIANKACKPLIVGPNVIDCVQVKLEKNLLAEVTPSVVLTVNKRIMFLASKQHSISLDVMDTLVIGPDTKLWSPTGKNEGFILWKGNAQHYAKDISFALKIKDSMPEYNFKILGYPSPYEYYSHIPVAKSAALYINTSISETKGNTNLEQLSCGVPSVVHPKIYLPGINYETGIITNRNVDDYQCAIKEIMDNKVLRKHLSEGAVDFVQRRFSEASVFEKYRSILEGLNVG
jgi:hypothetical protein